MLCTYKVIIKNSLKKVSRQNEKKWSFNKKNTIITTSIHHYCTTLETPVDF